MTYLDYFTYILLLGLFLLLVHKIVLNDSSKEGFVAVKNKKINYDKNGLPIEGPDDIDPPDPRWLVISKINYRIAADVAIMLIKMPYKLLSQGVMMIGGFIQNLNDLLTPIYDFIKQFYTIFKDLFMKVFKQFFNIFKQVFNIFGNLPAFIKENAERAIKFMNDMIQQFTSSIKTVLDIFQKIFDLILKLPQMVFSIFNKSITMLFNVVIMIIKLPENLLGMIIGFQEQMMSLMDKKFSIPFTDMFFK